jgi:uncharacterized protein (TIGR00251 family)
VSPGAPWLREVPGGVRITVRLSPKAARDKVLGVHGEALKIAITAPPVEGKANRHLIRFLAKRLGVAQGALSIVSGELSREKVIEAAGVRAAEAEAILGA